jgi:hypothetical protein
VPAVEMFDPKGQREVILLVRHRDASWLGLDVVNGEVACEMTGGIMFRILPGP